MGFIAKHDYAEGLSLEVYASDSGVRHYSLLHVADVTLATGADLAHAKTTITAFITQAQQALSTLERLRGNETLDDLQNHRGFAGYPVSL